MSLAREPGPWPVETIPDDDWLYRRIAPIFLKPDGTVSAKVFMRNADPRGRKKEPDADVSVDWDRYATPDQALLLANRPTHGIGALQARMPRGLDLMVVHTPDLQGGNRAHASIQGNEGSRARERCARLAEEVQRHMLIMPKEDM